MTTLKATSPVPVATANILDVDGTVMSYQVDGQLPVKIDLGVPCKAGGFLNLYEIGLFAAGCMGCDYNSSFGEGGCKGCNPEGSIPITLSDVLRGQREQKK